MASFILKSSVYGLSMFLIACASQSSPPASNIKPVLIMDGINKSDAEINALIAKAESGDAKSALILAEHCNWAMNNPKLAEVWYKRAAALGGIKEKQIYASFIEASQDDD